MYFLFLLTGLLFQDTSWNVNEYGVALYGYDPVSYFQGRPKRGQAELSFQYEEVIFYFSSVANLEIFMADPARYLPEYGGYCAYTMATTGDTMDINPLTYQITDGKLLLFLNKEGINHLKKWNEGNSRLLTKANKNWKKITGSKH